MVKQRIAEYVEGKGIKQIYISQETGISPQSVSLLLRGERNLEIDEYVKICDALGVPYNYFMPKRNKTSSKANIPKQNQPSA